MFNVNSLIVSFLFFTFIHSALVFPTTKQETIEEILLYGALNYHYAPIKISDEYSSLVFNNYLDKLDPNQIYDPAKGSMMKIRPTFRIHKEHRHSSCCSSNRSMVTSPKMSNGNVSNPLKILLGDVPNISA